MAIGRMSMTKELFGNRQKPKKMNMGGITTPTDMMNQRGREIADMAQSGGMQKMKKGGSVRGCGCATRGKSGAKVY